MTTHDEIQNLLESYVDETLNRETYRLVTGHLDGCDECRAILDEVAPVDLSGLGGGRVDERALRRSVRRAMRRTVFDASLMLLAAFMAFWLVGLLVVQPLVVNRGDRAASAARATLDLAVMVNEGAYVDEFSISSGPLSREFTAGLQLPVGSSSVDLESVQMWIGLFAVGSTSPYVDVGGGGGDASAQLSNLGQGTVATVALRFDRPLSIAEAQQFADSTEHDVRLVWVGFRIDAGDSFSGDLFGPGAVLGYSTCGARSGFSDDFLAATSAGSSGSPTLSNASSVERALGEVRGAVENLVEHPGLLEAPSWMRATEDLVTAAATHLALPDPGVASLVVTGPTLEVSGFLDQANPDSASVLAVDFYNWSTPVCGR